jgi:hypothetical protein
MTRYRLLAALLTATSIVACNGYDKTAVQDITAPLNGARIRFFNFSVNSPGVNFYANDMKVTAVSSASCVGVTDTTTVRICNTIGIESTTGVVYGGVGSAGFYSNIAPGQYTLNGRIAATVDRGLQVVKVPATLDNGKAYSVYASGPYNTATKTADGFIVEDPIPTDFDFTAAYVRFVNAISNSTPQTLFANNTTGGGETAIGGAVGYKSAGAFVKLTPGAYDLVTRSAGSSTAAITRTGVSFAAGRVYTITSRGDMTVTGTTAVNRPILENNTNR